MTNIRTKYLLPAAALILTACATDDLENPNSRPSDVIVFCESQDGTRASLSLPLYNAMEGIRAEESTDSLYVLQLQEDWSNPSDATRAEGVTGTYAIEKFDVTCVRNNSDGIATDYYFTKQPYKRSGTEFVNSNNITYFWAGSGQETYDFFATSLQGATATYNPSSPAPPKITYTVPTDNADQKDLVTAKYLSAPANWGQVVPLDFKHILTAIRFKAADDVLPGQITSIQISGVHNEGTFSFGTGQTADSWSLTDETDTYSVTPDVNISSGTGGNQTITPDDYIGTFMLMPQTLPEDAKITVNFKDAYSNTEFTFNMSLAGYVWPMGQIITYVISTNSIKATPVFTVTSDNASSLSDAGETANFSVTSHINLTGASGTQGNYAVAWTSKLGTYDESTGVFTEAGQNEYPWFDISGLQGTGLETSSESVQVYCSYIRGVVADNDTHLEALKGSTTASGSSQSSPYNLATNGGTESVSTANCYIVDGPGWYSFPLVYGNAIKNGATNTSAYTFSPDMTDWVSPYNEAGTEKGGYLSAFKDGNGTTISSPSISGVNSAELIWSNEDNVIQNVQISGTNVVFYVPEETITQNNALIAVKNASNTILWSWHIWITDRGKSADDIDVTANSWYEYSNTNSSWSANNSIDETTDLNTSYSFMDVPLGYRDECKLVYPSRSVWVEFEQTGTGQKVYIQVTQNGKNGTRDAQTMYYQFGRKDPFSQYVGTTTSDVNGTNTDLYPYYYNKRTSYIQSAGNSYTYKDYTSGPDIYYYSSSTYPRYWNPWNNSTTIPTYQSGTTQYNIYNYLCNYFINDPSRVVKTVYDPSPRGYTVMPGQSISGFTARGLTAGTGGNSSGTDIWSSHASCTWSGTGTTNGKNINCTATSQPATTFGTTLEFYTTPMTTVGSVGGGSTTIGFQNLGTLSGKAATFKTVNGYYWTANKERNITKADGSSLSLEDSYQAGCLFTFGTTLTDNDGAYAVTIRTKTAFGVRSCCPVRCTKE